MIGAGGAVHAETGDWTEDRDRLGSYYGSGLETDYDLSLEQST
jgi:hypothetical protein